MKKFLGRENIRKCMTGIKTVISGESALHRFISRKCKSDIPLENIFGHLKIFAKYFEE